jgi:hypothetical protein
MPTAPERMPFAISPKTRPAVERLQAVLTRLVGSQLLSLDLTGPALEGVSLPRLLESVLVMAADDLPALRELGGHGKSFAKAGVAAPLVLTPQSITSSLDAFPLEFLDISQRRIHLQGQDFFSGLVCEHQFIRLQCERELKTVAMAMRQRTLRSPDRDVWHAHDLAENVLRVLRGYIVLRGAPIQSSSDAVLTGAEALLGHALPALRQALAGAPHWEAFSGFYAEVSALGTAADAW